MIKDRSVRRVLKPLVFLAALTPASYLLWAFFTEHLSANPLSDITNTTGDWTLRFLCVTLGVTPLRRITGWNGAVRFRRMLGLFAFFYGVLHFLTYIVFDRLASVEFIGNISWRFVNALTAAVNDDVHKRPFITIGFTAFVLMMPLAATSTVGMIRRLGGRRWQALHRLMYVSCVGAVVHYWWLVKADVRRPAAYGVAVALLLTLRLSWTRIHGSLAASASLTQRSPRASRRRWRSGCGRPVSSSRDLPTTTNPSAP
jgi:sulfoxide reductase heme-binding subunit YedZ